MAKAKPERRTQEERTAAMRERLLDATVECLVELGYAKTTTTAVTQRAGVSRGAQLHHFPTKQDLVTSAVDHVMQKRLERFAATFSSLSVDGDVVETLIEQLWDAFSGPIFYAWLELIVAARTDPELKDAVTAIADNFDRLVDQTFRSMFGIEGDSGALALAPRFTFLLMEGMAIERIRKEDPRLERAVIKTLVQLAPRGVEGAAS